MIADWSILIYFYTVRYLLFTRENRTEGQKLRESVDLFNKSNFKRDKPVRMIIHGLGGNAGSEINRELIAAYLRKADLNVIVIDWSNKSCVFIPRYIENFDVSSKIVKFLKFLVATNISSLDKVNIVGHSMGAHIAGLAGKKFPKNSKYGQIQRIIALDPAAPNHEHSNEDKRFAPSDAAYTEAIHTDTKMFGIEYPVAHADFYPNGGKSQPGCSFLSNFNFSSVSASSSAKTNSHSRAWEYFAESIESCDFIARRCLDYKDLKQGFCRGEGTAIMGGEPGNIDLKGVFYLKTNPIRPYAKGAKRAREIK